MVGSTSPWVLSGWESSNARIEGGSISGISARPRTPRRAAFPTAASPPPARHRTIGRSGARGRGTNHRAHTAHAIGADYDRRHVQNISSSQRPARRHPPHERRQVGRGDGDVRRRQPLRDQAVQRHRTLQRAHVLQGHRAAAHCEGHLGRGGRHRRRVQRLHRQGVHRLLHQVRRRAPGAGARCAGRSAARVPLRRRRDRAREGRDHRGAEHVRRHSSRPHRLGLRDAAVRRPAAGLGHHRHQGHDPRQPTARPSSTTCTTGTRRGAWWWERPERSTATS